MKKISASILSKKDNYSEIINEYNILDIDYLHLDIMDSTFTENSSFSIEDIKNIINISKKKLDVHLMVDDPIKYIDLFNNDNTEYITIHFEILNNYSLFEMIKNKGIKLGISIKPDTNINCIIPLLKYFDLVLLMSVEPGKSGQKFIEDTYNRINILRDEIVKNNYSIMISVDGGINEINSKDLNADIFIIDSALSNSNDRKKFINNIKTN
jgi:ribulose-phosphate 3-epimerase